MGLQCVTCTLAISRTKQECFITCRPCSKSWHVKCLNLDGTTAKEIKSSHPNWQCSSCVKASTTESPILPNDSESAVNISNSDQLADLSSSDISQAIHQMNDDLDKLKATQQQFSNGLTSFGVHLNKLSSMSHQIDEHSDRISGLEDQNLVYKKQIAKLDRRIDDVEQKNRAHNIQIDGIPETNHENLRNVISTLASQLKVVLSTGDITYAARVRSTNKTKVKPVICSLSNFKVMSELIKASRTTKPTATNAGFPNNNNSVFINEHLTVARKQLLYKAKQFKAANNFEFLWIKDGKIYIKKNKDTKAININVSTDFSVLT